MNISVLVSHRHDFVDYCKYLANRYNETLEGQYRIKYNDLYPCLYETISDTKREELFSSFLTSLDIYPLEPRKNSEKITFKHF
tara:strand:+ start:1506 stop:1754 length:249 start_codon:yes stop_codon:yes gene_type:complete